MPRIKEFLLKWRRKTLWLDGIIFGGLLLSFIAVTIWAGYWEGLSLKLPFVDNLPGGKYTLYGLLGVLVLAAAYIHVSVRQWAAKTSSNKLLKKINDPESLPNYTRAFRKNSAWYRSIFRRQPAGWTKRAKQRLVKILENNNAFVQNLNDMYTNPSGDKTYLSTKDSQCVDDTISVE